MADAGGSAGCGHLGRCLALAQAFEALGQRPVLLDVPPKARGWLKARGGRTAAFAGRWDVLIADSYRFSKSDLLRLRARARAFLAVDDSGRFTAPCDWILNGHLYARSIAFRAPASAGLLLGPKFLPLRREYWTPPRPRHCPPRVRRVLLTLGGNPQPALLARVRDIVARALPKARLETATDVPCLRPLLERCELCVCAGGQTLYEALLTGAPTVALELAPNQRANLSAAAEAGAAVNAGVPGPRLGALLRRLDRDAALRRALAGRGPSLIDGSGALRVARLLLGEAA
ncbi:MAG: hypothetical protein KGK30_03490 [Elusimicrobia bacterium]|nr:hypothetical protein [Elusimicrobiota bacterium]